MFVIFVYKWAWRIEFRFCLLVDMCHQQHLQTDLSHWQSRGGSLFQYFSPFLLTCVAVVLYKMIHPTYKCKSCCFVFLGSCNQVKPDSPTSSDSHYHLWEKTWSSPFQVKCSLSWTRACCVLSCVPLTGQPSPRPLWALALQTFFISSKFPYFWCFLLKARRDAKCWG